MESDQDNHEQLGSIARRKYAQSERTAQVNAINWLTDHFSNRGKALWLCKRGMAKAKNHGHQGAIDDDTKAIRPAKVKAMVLFNRALVHVAMGDDRKRDDDLDAVIAMDEAPRVSRTGPGKQTTLARTAREQAVG